MATHTLGTNANNSLTAVTFNPGYGSGLLPADIATMAAIKDDVINGHPVIPGSFSADGLLIIPRRGLLRCYPGDVVALDSRGWPVLLSADTIANGPWHFV